MHAIADGCVHTPVFSVLAGLDKQVQRGDARKEAEMRKRIGLIMCVMVVGVVLESPADWVSGYAYRKEITIDADAVSGASDHTDFPVLVSVTDADLATTANGGDVENANGYDIVFTGSDGSSALDH